MSDLLPSAGLFRIGSQTPELRIAAECADWVAIDKPPGVLVHPTKPTGEKTMLDVLRDRIPGEFLAPVNRLDRETSGLCLFARSSEAASKLGKLLMHGGLFKEYLAIVDGLLRDDEGVIDQPIARAPDRGPGWVVSKRAIDPAGQQARTRFKVLQRGQRRTLLHLVPETGRLHQIRVHLAWLGHWVVGDKIYGPDERLWLKFCESGVTADMLAQLGHYRHALHAWKLRFQWGEGERQIEAELPNDLRELLATSL